MAAVRTYPAAAAVAGLVFGHGAGAGEDHPWIEHVGRGLSGRGITVSTFNFPYRDAGRRAPDPPRVLEEAFRAAWTTASHALALPLFAGGKSMGGRIATQTAARLEPAPRGVVCLGYPLHPPGKPTERRDQHLPRMGVPVLFVSGTKDPFGSPDELRALSASLDGAALELFDGGDHSIQTRRRGAENELLDRAIVVAADWMRAIVTAGQASAPARR
jgi:predicted alpha/beta-hydrolase family hydrolase